MEGFLFGNIKYFSYIVFMYYLYHIPKRKEWGCTKYLDKWIKTLGYTISGVDRIITAGNINKAANMEKQLNIEYGYGWSERHDYRVVCKMNKPFDKKSQSKGGITQSSKIIKCPHCNKIGKGMIMGRWHMDNCRLKS